jgi:CBS-domain-containing membrane protein
MTTGVETVTPNADFKSVAQLLRSHHIDLVPVVDDERRVVGVVSEADLLAKVQWQGRHPGRIERWLLLDDQLRKAEGTLASQVMTLDVEAVGPDASVNEAAQRMMVNHLKSMPVLDSERRLVGIVSRGDLLRSFVRDDAAIHREVAEDILAGALAIDPAAVTVVVREGKVFLKGEVESWSLGEMAVRMVGAVPGVVTVVNALDNRLDDRYPKFATEPAQALSYSGPPLR